MGGFARRVALAAIFAASAAGTRSFRASHDRAIRVGRLLTQEASRLDSVELTSLAQLSFEAGASDNPGSLDNVKSLIRRMLTSAMDAHNEDTTHAEFCKKQVKDSKEKVTTLQDRIEKATADHDRLTAEMAELKDNIQDAYTAVADATKGKAKVAEMQAEAEKAGESRRTATINEDFEVRLEKNREGADQELKLQHQLNDLENEIATRGKEAKDKESKIVHMTREESEMSNDLRGLQMQLDAAKQYDKEIASQCTVRTDSGKVRQQRRQEEIGSLKDAYQILNGDAIP